MENESASSARRFEAQEDQFERFNVECQVLLGLCTAKADVNGSRNDMFS